MTGLWRFVQWVGWLWREREILGFGKEEETGCDPCGGGQREPWVWKGIRDFCEGRERENALDLERKKRLGVEEREAFGKDEDSDFREREREIERCGGFCLKRKGDI